ncbi:rCG32342 [Rattus norvegicus]|uniref:RCG32342 n=1 Tax=Rattus norvegicus TaxID=10116 RepID=A6JXM7_RAT|nr:rCG32342 [Rattus norvegicus]
MTQQNTLEPDCLTQRGLRESTSHFTSRSQDLSERAKRTELVPS